MPRHAIRPVIILLAILGLSGCFIRGTIDAKGAGTMTVKYRLTTEAQLEPNKKRFDSQYVKVTSATVDKDKWATYELKFDDITKLPTTAFFHTTTFNLADGPDGTKVLTIKHVNKTPNKLPDEMVAYFGKEAQLSMTVPGPIVQSNATSTADKTATWTYPMNDFTNAPELNLSVTFKVPKEGEQVEAGKGALNATPANAEAKESKPATATGSTPTTGK